MAGLFNIFIIRGGDIIFVRFFGEDYVVEMVM